LAACPAACAIGGLENPTCYICAGACVTAVPAAAAASILILRGEWAKTAEKFDKTSAGFDDMANKAKDLENDAESKGKKLAAFEAELKATQDFVGKYHGVEQVAHHKALWMKHLNSVVDACNDLVKTNGRRLYESYRELVDMITAKNSSESP